MRRPRPPHRNLQLPLSVATVAGICPVSLGPLQVDKARPAITEPTPSLTFDLSVISDGPRRGAAFDAINAEVLRAFVWSLPDVPELIALDWQHPAHSFRPAEQALTWHAEWKMTPYPDGDYYVLLSPDFNHETFGHPWERALCVMGEPLIASLGLTLGAWLPVKRRNGSPT